MRGGVVDCDNIEDKCKWLKEVKDITSDVVGLESNIDCAVNVKSAICKNNIKSKVTALVNHINILEKSSPQDDNKLSNAQELLKQGQEYINCMSPNSANVGAEQTTQDENDAILAEEQKRLVEEAERQKLAEAEKVAADKLAADKLAADKLAAAKRQQEAAAEAKRQQEAAVKRQQEAAVKRQQEAAAEAKRQQKEAKENNENERFNNICKNLPDTSFAKIEISQETDISQKDTPKVVYKYNYFNNGKVYTKIDELIDELEKVPVSDFTNWYNQFNNNITRIKVSNGLYARIFRICPERQKYFETTESSGGSRKRKHTTKRR
jgi:hypothetical protein